MHRNALTCASIGASACQDGQRKLIKGTDCSMYEECKSGVNFLQVCKPGEIFDNETLSCRPVTDAACTDAAGGCDSSSVFSHPHSCRLYYKCNGKRIVTKLCPIGELYDPAVKSCRHGVLCNETSCREGTLRAVDFDNSQYEKCENGKWIRKACQRKSFFDEESLSCMTEETINKCMEGETMSLNCNQYISCKEGSWLLSSCALGDVFDEEIGVCKTGVCKARSKRNVKACVEGRKRRVDGSCKKYTECLDGKEVEKTCSSCMNFHDESKSCRYVFAFPCPNPAPPVPTDPPTTPEPTTPEPTTPEPTTPEPTTLAPSTPAPSTPGPSTPGPSTPGPSTPGPSTPGPSTPGPSTPGPSPPGPSTPGPSTPGPSTPGPSTPGPSTPEPSTPGPSTPEPSTPGPSTPGPSTPEKSTPAPSTPAPSSPEVSSQSPNPNPRPTIPPNTAPRPIPVSTKESSVTTVRPSPVPVCKDGERKVIPGECKNYLECQQGKYYTTQCNYFQHFDKITMDCSYFGYTCP